MSDTELFTVIGVFDNTAVVVLHPNEDNRTTDAAAVAWDRASRDDSRRIAEHAMRLTEEELNDLVTDASEYLVDAAAPRGPKPHIREIAFGLPRDEAKTFGAQVTILQQRYGTKTVVAAIQRAVAEAAAELPPGNG